MEQLLAQIDITNISPYLIIVLWIIVQKWESIGTAIKGIFHRRSTIGDEERRHLQELEEVFTNRQITAEMRQREIENQALEILHEQMQWSREDFSRLQTRLESVHFIVNRTNDILTILNQNLTDLIDRRLNPNETLNLSKRNPD